MRACPLNAGVHLPTIPGAHLVTSGPRAVVPGMVQCVKYFFGNPSKVAFQTVMVRSGSVLASSKQRCSGLNVPWPGVQSFFASLDCYCHHHPCTHLRYTPLQPFSCVRRPRWEPRTTRKISPFVVAELHLMFKKVCAQPLSTSSCGAASLIPSLAPLTPAVFC